MKTRRFSKGDRVKIKKDLIIGEKYDGYLFTSDAIKYKGKIATMF